jgi:FKBP-type peptidyl-prolyl cis-trans isomerase FklB
MLELCVWAGLLVDPAHSGFLSEKKETTVKTRICVVMLALGCLLGLSVYAAQQGSKGKPGVPPSAGEVAIPKAALLKTEVDKVSYVIGTQLGQNFKRQGIQVNVESLTWGLKDALAGKKLALSQDEMRQVMTSFQQRVMAEQGAKNLAEGKAFLEANKAKEGVKVLPSGLQYKVIEQGTGKSPTANDKVRTHYRGTLINGTEFDSSYKRNKPAEFAVSGVIEGWTEALQLMKEGGKWELYIPANLAYGARARPNIPPNSTLIFEVELLAVIK